MASMCPRIFQSEIRSVAWRMWTLERKATVLSTWVRQGETQHLVSRCMAQPNATARMPKGTLVDKLPNAQLRARCASLRRGNDSRPATTGCRSVDYAVARPKRRERYGDERRSATAKKKTTSSLTPGGLSRPFETQTHSMNALTEEPWR